MSDPVAGLVALLRDTAPGGNGGQPAESVPDEIELDAPSVEPVVSGLAAVPVAAFVAVDEPGAEPLLGSPGEPLIPENGDVMVYGDGGAGKTTLTIDAAFHLAAGDDWLGIPVARPLSVLLIENEGPRPLFRAKLRRKLEHWHGSPVDDRLRVVEEPWADFSFADERCRGELARTIAEHKVDVVIVGPVTRSGMDDAGTLQEVRDFMIMVNAVRRLAGRHVTFWLVHHEAKGGKVSGAWEGAGDTLLHVQGQGHGRARLYVQKARWSSAHHATTLYLKWTDGEGFELDEREELDDDSIADKILAYVAENPGTGWNGAERAAKGVAKDRRRAVRDRLLRDGLLLNVATIDGEDVALDHVPERQKARLYRADDPTVAHLRPGSGAAPAQSEPLWGGRADERLRPAPRPIGGAGGAGAVAAPLDEELEW